MPLTTEDRLEIAELVARYNHAIDSGDGKGFADTFTEDGVLDIPGRVLEGRAALEKFATAFAGSVRAPRHIASNLVVEGDGATDEVSLSAYVQMFALDGDPPRQVVVAAGKYADRLSRSDGRWRFSHRVFISDIEG